MAFTETTRGRHFPQADLGEVVLRIIAAVPGLNLIISPPRTIILSDPAGSVRVTASGEPDGFAVVRGNGDKRNIADIVLDAPEG